MNYFKNCTTIDAAKAKYRELCKLHHPDRGGDTTIMQQINAQFDDFKPETEKYKGEADQFNAREFAHIVEQLLNISNITVEICGSWVWLSDTVKEQRELIKAIDTGDSYRRGWSKNKGKWYFSPVGYRKRSKKTVTMEKIRDLYGSETHKREKDKIY